MHPARACHFAIVAYTLGALQVAAYTGTLAGWDVRGTGGGLNNYGPSPFAPTTNAQNLTFSGLVRGFGVRLSGTAASNAWGGTGFTSTTADAAIASGEFVSFSVSANAGYKVSFSCINRFDIRRSPIGPSSGILQFQIGSGTFITAADFDYFVGGDDQGSFGVIDLSGFTALQNVGIGTNVTFRIVSFGGTSAAGTWYISDVGDSHDTDLELWGTVTSTTPSAPKLTVLQTNGNLVVSWPALATSFALQQSGDLSETNWGMFSGSIENDGTSFTATVGATNGKAFFRLVAPNE